MRKQKTPPTNRRPADKTPARAPAFSYYSSRSTAGAKSGRLKQEVKRSLRWQLIPSFIAALVIFGSLVYVSLLDPKPRLAIEDTAGAAMLQDKSVYAAAAQKHLQASIFSRSKLLINTKSIESQLLAEFPELKTVGIAIPIAGRQPIITIKAAEPRLVLTTAEGNYIIDSAGRAVLKVTNLELAAKLGLPSLQDDSGLGVELGRVTLTAHEAGFVSELNHQLGAKSVAVDSMILPTLVNELHLRPKGQPYFVKFNLQGDARQQAGTLLAILARFNREGIKPAEYIDVRVEEKVFYK